MKNEKGMILLVVFMVMTVLSIILPAYVTWSIWDQKNLLRQQKVEEAKALARAGLNRAKLDLHMDSNWLDGEINNTSVTVPDPNNPDTLYTLYADQALGGGTYTVQIDYLQKPKTCTLGCSFYTNRIFVRSTGTITDPETSSTLEEYVNTYPVKNYTLDKLYALLQLAVDEVRDSDEIRITAAGLSEDIAITSHTFTITGCYDPDFEYRSCNDYASVIQGTLAITGSADVTLSGVTIE